MNENLKKDTYTIEDIMTLCKSFDIILNDTINMYEEEIYKIYMENSIKNKIKRKIKKIFRLR